ncbi:phage baseplate assembly protein V [Paenibacillus sp. NRS-1760]|uniref:phage baseplate assembly protein V n=1 Tax=Paenibacillus sp. NRS-1760 TaxID=3233902 RepID=UPI003D2AFB65
MKNLIRAGRVSTVNAKTCAVRVVFGDIDNLVSKELPLLLHAGNYVLPEVGQRVLCVFFGNGVSEGLCLGTFYTDEDTPPTVLPSNRGVWFPDGSHVYHNSLTGVLHVMAAGRVRIDGDLEVTGTITHGGLIP